MKRIIAVILTLSVLCSLFSVPAFAATDQAELSITPSQTTMVSPKTDTEVVYTVNVKLLDTSEKIGSAGFTLVAPSAITFTTDPSKWQVAEVTENVFSNAYKPDTKVYTLVYMDSTDKTDIDLLKISATIAAGTTGSQKVTLSNYAVSDAVGNELKLKVIENEINFVSELTGNLPVAITKPAKGGTPETNITGTNYAGSIIWDPAVSTTFAANTEYTAKVTLTANTGYQFASDVNPAVTDATITDKSVSSDGSKLEFKATFPATVNKNPLKGSVTIDKINPKLGDKLTATPALDYNGETAGTLSYQWYRGDTAIPSATGSSYTTVAADVGKTIKVEVKNSNNSDRVTSAPTAVVAAADYTGAPATAAVTDNAHRWDKKIEITSVTDGQEYAITTGSTAPTEGWQDGGVFTGLMKDTAYTVYTRVKATPTMAASASVTTSVKTKKAMYPGAFDLSGLTSVYYYNGSAQDPSVSYKSGYSAATVGGFTFKYEKNESGYPPVPECKLPGAYRVTIVTDNNGSDYAAGESFVGVFSISPGNLTAANFQVTGLTTHDYDGSPKKATVAPNPGVEGVGAITVYYEGVGTTSYTRQTTAPTNAGSYKVSVDVATGDYYNGINNLVLGTLTIKKVNYTGTTTFTETVRSGQATTNKTLTLPTLPDGASYGTPTVGGTTALISAQSVSGATLTYSTTNQTDGTSATITIPVTDATNYNNYSIVVTVTAKDKEDAGVSISGAPTSKTYGDANFTLTATKSASAPDGGTWKWTSSDDTVLKIVDGADSATATVQVLKASATGATLTVTYTSGTHYGSSSATITVAQKEVTVAPGTYKVSKEYDTTTAAAGTGSGTLSVTGIVDSSVSVKATPVAYTSPNVGGQSTMDVNITLVGSGNANYKIKGGATTISVPCEITAKDVKLTGGINATDRSYVKDNKTVSLTKGTLTFTGLVGSETLDVNIPATGTISDAKVGAYNVTYSGVTLKDGTTGKASNYKLVSPLPTVTVNITKATAPTLTNITVSQKYTTTTGEKTIGAVMPADAGTLTYTKGTTSKTGSVAIDSWNVDTTGKVTYTLSGGVAGDTVTLPVIIGSDNYANATVKLVITLTAKDDQAPLTLTGGTTVVYGQTLQLGTTGGNGTGAVTYAVTNGTGEATIDAATGKLTPVKVGTVKVKATKAEDANYNAITSAEVEITITKATPTGEPAYTKITTSGKTLADAGLTTTGSMLNPNAGTLVWVDDAGNVLPGTTAVAANTTYKWLFTPADTNYDKLTGTIKLWSKSSGGGSGRTAAVVAPDMPMLYRGCTGDAVKTLQEKLNAKGFDSGNVDGIFGAKTYAAVTAFQKANSLGVDGIVGKLTWAKLYDATPVNVTPVTTQPMLRTGSRGDAVRKLQELLNAKGYTCGSVDGIFGSKTYAAVLAFQKANGLAADGIVGPLTWGKLV